MIAYVQIRHHDGYLTEIEILKIGTYDECVDVILEHFNKYAINPMKKEHLINKLNNDELYKVNADYGYTEYKLRDV